MSKLATRREDYAAARVEALRVLDECIGRAGGPERVLLAYSGGKDSLVSAHLARTERGVRGAVMDSSMQFLRAIDDAVSTAREVLDLDLEAWDRFGRDYPARNPKWAMPPEREQGALYARRQQATAKTYAKRWGYRAIVYGRRKSENTVPSPLYETGDGLIQCHPLREWTTAQVWTYIEDCGLPTPVIYGYRVGRLWGATPWAFMAPEKLAGGEAEAWDMMAEFCPRTLREQARYFEGARAAAARYGIPLDK